MRNAILAAILHSALSGFGHLEATFLQSMGVVLQQMFNESIQSHYGQIPSESELNAVHSVIGATVMIGILVGGVLAGRLMDIYGRKSVGIYFRGMVGGSASFCAFVSGLLVSVELYAISHFLAGVAQGLNVVLVIYVSEFSPDEYRGTLTVMLGSGSAILLMMFQPLSLPQVLGDREHWWAIPLVVLSLAIAHVSLSSIFPESPKHLYLNERNERAAIDSIRYYMGPNADVHEILAEYDRECDLVHSKHMSLFEVISNESVRLPFLIIVIGNLIAPFSASGIKSQYLQNIFANLGMASEDASFAILTLTFIATPFTLIAPFLIERLGRRPLFLGIIVLNTVEWGLFLFSQMSVRSSAGSLLGIMAAGIGNVSSMVGLLSVGAILLSELCPFPAKAAVTEFVQIWPALISTGVIFAYPLVSTSFGAQFDLLMLCIGLILFGLLYRLMPETRLSHVDSVVRQLSALPSARASRSHSTIDERTALIQK